MNIASLNADRNPTNTNKEGDLNNHGQSNMFLASGMLCYIIAFFLFYFQKEITSSAPLTKLGFSLEILAEHLWSVPSALVITLFFLSISSLYYYTRIRGKDVRCLWWCIVPPPLFFMKCLLFLLFFIYTIFPLRWAQRSFTRAPESFPDYTPFDSIPMLLILTGTIFCSLY